ncbi:hypothetical protein PC9H_009511 [Pleurotus ostreatus]|uniref:Cytoplasmic tRNA 2-thiolation protein 2 n=1 Tax=Pleurotus ostreatus TaxID=5322 RepID=A0A8H6ZPU9_PLEOS|nr:uncharacterized protein PC9H_009511 [Pleurotus ostreatus]KAF7424207.1 hypothetical protein PC9H_009511 [Pleurotus ostreatus]
MTSCGNPAAEIDALMTRRPKFDHSKECVKCKGRVGNIVIRHVVYCRECFLPLVNTKFRKILQPSIKEKLDGPRQKSLKASGNLTMGLSGGLGSTVLMDLVAKNYFRSSGPEDNKGGKDHPRKLNEKVWKAGYVCYVEVSDAFPGMRDSTADIRAIVESYNVFEFVPLKLEDAFDPSWWDRVDLLLCDIPSSNFSTPLDRLRAYLSAMPTQTALLSSVQALIRLLLLYSARSTQSSHLLLGTSLTSLSINLISGIAQGGGFAVREEVDEEWHTGTEMTIRVIRPLRDLTMKECTAWAWWNHLTVVGETPIPSAKQGIGSLTKDFIVGLETDYPSTVSTIARTCSKLAPKDKATGVCALCQRPTQFRAQQWKSQISILSYSNSKESTDRISLAPSLCYACHTSLTGRNSRSVNRSVKSHDDITSDVPIPLPVWVQSHASMQSNSRGSGTSLIDDASTDIMKVRKMNREEMKEQIGSYLLDDDL